MLRVWMLTCFLQTYGLLRQKQLPDFVRPCVDDPNLTKCPALILEDLRPRLAEGIPEFRLPSFDPLHVPLITVTRKTSSIADYTTNLTNIVWTGGKDFQVLQTFINPKTLVFRLKLAFPYLQMTCESYANGTIFNFELRGEGGFTFNSTNVVLDIVLNGETHTRKGLEYIRWKKEDIGISYEEFYFVHMYGFFKDPTLSQLFKIALNQGIRLLGSSARAAIDRSVGNFIIEAINRVHSLYPKNVLYPIY